MIKRRWLVLLVLSSLLVGLMALPSPSVLPGLNLLVFGQLEVRRNGWPQYRITQAFAELFSTDSIRAARGSSARVLCANWKFLSVPSGRSVPMNQLCPPTAQPIIRRSSGNLIPPRGGTDPLIPFLITPRHTTLLDSTPMIRWNRTPSATRYRVSLRDSSGVIWQQEVEGTETAYPGTPALQPGLRYALVVQADTGASSQDEDVPGLALRLMQPEQIREIQSKLAQLQQTSQNEIERLIAQAYLYRSNDLLADAIALLETPTARNHRNPLIHRLRGDLYRQVRLNLLARNAYEQAIALATAPEFLEEKAQAQAALGKVLLMLRDRRGAVTALQQARVAYGILEGEESDRGRQLDEQLAELTE